MIFAEQRPVIPSAIVLISPHFGADTPTVDIHGKSTKIGVLLRGPDWMGLQTGGAMVAYMFGKDFLADVAGINLIGGWADFDITWTERLHSSFGFGIDNPMDGTVGPGFPTQNAFVFANLIWEMSRFAEAGFEIAKWDTDYAPAPGLEDNAPGDNEAMIYRTRVVFRF